MTAVMPQGPANMEAPPPEQPPAPVREGNLKGRSCCNISSRVAKALAYTALTVLGIVALAALIVGIVFLINPAGFGVGNFLGAGLASFGALLGTLIMKAAVWIGAHALVITITSAVALSIIGATAAGIAIAKSCKKAMDDVDTTINQPQALNSPEGATPIAPTAVVLAAGT